MKYALALVAIVVLALVLWKTSEAPPPTAAPPAPEASVAGDTPVVPPPARKLDPRDDPNLPFGEDQGEPQPPPEAISFDLLPPSHGAAVVRRKVADFADALDDRFAAAKVQVLDPECDSAPCIVGFDYDAPAVAASELGARAFHEGVRAAFAETLGFSVTSMHIDEIEGGKQIWMFAVPAEIAKDDPLRNRLIETGHHRHAALIGDLPTSGGDEDRAPLGGSEE